MLSFEPLLGPIISPGVKIFTVYTMLGCLLSSLKNCLIVVIEKHFPSIFEC